MNWHMEAIRLELKYTWKISRNASDAKTNFVVRLSDAGSDAMGEVAPNVRYGETPESIISAFDRFIKAGPDTISSLQELSALLDSLRLPNALRFGIESVFIHLLCKKQGTALYEYLGLNNPGPVSTCYSLPIMDVADIATFYKDHKLERFSLIKIKVNAEHAVEEVNALAAVCNKPLLIDGNEAWSDPDKLLMVMEQLKSINIEFIEQPMPAGLEEEYRYLKARSAFTLMADESICDHADFTSLSQQFHGVNMKLMKAGGYLNGLHILNEARNHGLKTMVGCMVETSLGINGAWNLCNGIDYADLDGFMIVKDEPFGMVKEYEGDVLGNL